MQMTTDEIKVMYRQAKDPKAQIRILAELNECSKGEIEAILGIRGGKSMSETKKAKEKAKTSGRKKKKAHMWTAEEAHDLICLMDEGMRPGEIAERLGIDKTVVYSKIKWIKNHRKGEFCKMTKDNDENVREAELESAASSDPAEEVAEESSDIEAKGADENRVEVLEHLKSLICISELVSEQRAEVIELMLKQSFELSRKVITGLNELIGGDKA